MSSSTRPQRSILSFGLEVEFLIKPRVHIIQELEDQGWESGAKPESPGGKDAPLKTVNRRLMRQFIAQTLTAGRIPTGLQTEGYQRWTVKDESTLDEFSEYWRVEIVSRTLTTDINWQAEVDGVFNLLRRDWAIRLTTGCSMHIHVSPGPNEEDKYTPQEVRQILKGIAYWDNAITKVMPADRKANPWAMSCFALPSCAKPNVREKFAKLESDYNQVRTRGWQHLFEKLDRQVKFRQHANMVVMRDERYLSWNFNHVDSQCGTVEFRRPPGVQTAKEAKLWIAVALGLVRQSLDTNWAHHGKEMQHASCKEFGQFVQRGMARLGRTCVNCVTEGDLKEDLAPARVFSRDETRLIEEKKAIKKAQPSPYAIKASSRPNTPV